MTVYRAEGCYQDRFEEKAHQISLPPPEPDSLDLKLVHPPYVGYRVYQWINAHELSLQKDLADLVERIEYIDFCSFLKHLGKSIKRAMYSLSEWQNTRFLPKEDAIVLVEGGKSNKWVAELAMHYFEFRPKACIRLGEKDARAFYCFVDAQAQIDWERIKSAFYNKTIVLFDDGSFSGMQMANHVEGVLQTCHVFSLKIRAISVIVPFMTKAAYDAITAVSQKIDQNIRVIITPTHKIPMLMDSASGKRLASLWYSHRMKEIDPYLLGLLWFQHKVPNGKSFPEALVTPSVYRSLQSVLPDFKGAFIPEIIPPYKFS